MWHKRAWGIVKFWQHQAVGKTRFEPEVSDNLIKQAHTLHANMKTDQEADEARYEARRKEGSQTWGK